MGISVWEIVTDVSGDGFSVLVTVVVGQVAEVEGVQMQVMTVCAIVEVREFTIVEARVVSIVEVSIVGNWVVKLEVRKYVS